MKNGEGNKFGKEPLLLAPEPRDDLLFYAGQIISGILNECVLNIGIFGAYCTGKTSIIETLVSYLKSREQQDGKKKDRWDDDVLKGIKIKRITLTNFRKNDSSGGRKTSSERLQAAIMKQLYYGESTWKLKWSKIARESRWQLAIALIAVSLIFVTVEIWAIKSIIANDILDNAFVILSMLSVIATVGVIIFVLPVVSRKVRIEKVGTNNFSFSLDQKPKMFDEFFDEIIYYLSVTKYNVIIFEDLDRFDQDLIYYELRRLNYMINNSAWWHKRKVTFIYALKDSVIPNSDDRAKFFELPIYVIPFASVGNVEGYIIDQFKYYNIEIDNKGLLLVLANRLNDYRQVTAFANMSASGIKIIKNGVLNWIQEEKIIATLLIRHCYPEEYEKMQLGSGEVDKLYKDCNKKRGNEIKELNGKIIEKVGIPDDIFEQKSSMVWRRICDDAQLQYGGAAFDAEYLSGGQFSEQDISTEEFWRRAQKDGGINVRRLGTVRKIELDVLTGNDSDLKLAIKYIDEDMTRLKKDLEVIRSRNIWDFMEDMPKEEDVIKKLVWDLKNVGALDDSYRSYISPYIGGRVTSEVLNYVENNIRGNNIREDATFTEEEWRDIVGRVGAFNGFDSLGFLNYSFVDCVLSGKIDDLSINEFVERQEKNKEELLGFYYNYIEYCIDDKGKNANIEKITGALAELFAVELVELIYEKNMLNHNFGVRIASLILKDAARLGRIALSDSVSVYLKDNADKICDLDTVGFFIKNIIKVPDLDAISENVREMLAVNGCFELSRANTKYLLKAPLESILADCDDPKIIADVLSSKSLNKELLTRILEYYIPLKDDPVFADIVYDLTRAVKRTRVVVSVDILTVLASRVDSGLVRQIVANQLQNMSKEELVSILGDYGGEFQKINGGRKSWVKLFDERDYKIADKLAEYGILDKKKNFKQEWRARVLQSI